MRRLARPCSRALVLTLVVIGLGMVTVRLPQRGAAASPGAIPKSPSISLSGTELSRPARQADLLRGSRSTPQRRSRDAGPDLELELEVVDSVAPGGSLTFTLTVSNAGDAAASEVELILRLPAPLEAEAASPAGTLPAAGEVLWDLGTLEAGEARGIVLRARVPVGASAVENRRVEAQASALESEADLSNNERFHDIDVAPANLALQIGRMGALVRPGQRITHTVTLFNVSRQAAEGLVVDVNLGGGATWVRDNADAPENGFKREALAGGVRWRKARIEGPSTVHFDLVSQVPRDAQPGQTLVHRVSVTSATRDDVPGNNRVDAAPLGVVVPDLHLSVEGPPEALPDDVVEFSIRYGNRGTGSALNPRITDTLPAGMTFLSSIPPATRLGPRTLRWLPGEIGVGDEDIIRVQARLEGSPAAGTELVNRVEIGSDAPDLSPSDNLAQTRTLVVPGAPAALELSVGATELPVDDGRTELRAQVRDTFGNLVRDPVTVTFTAGGGWMDPPAVLSVAGVATSTFVAGPNPGNVSLSAKAGKVRADASAMLLPADISLSGQILGPEGPAGSSQIMPGDRIDYRLVLRNRDAAKARGLQLVAALEERIRIVELAGSEVAVEQPDFREGILDLPSEGYLRHGWDLPDLAAGETLTLTLRMRAEREGGAPWTGFNPLFFRAAISTTTAERGQLDRIHSEKVDILASDLFTGLSIRSGVSAIRPGGQLVYDLTFGNIEPAVVDRAFVTFTLPISTSFDHWMPVAGNAPEPVAGTFQEGSRSLVWSIEEPLERSSNVRLWVNIDPRAPSEQLLVGGLDIGSAFYDINPANNLTLDSGAWLRGVNLGAAVQGPPTAAPGEDFTWRLVVTNAALRDSANDVVLSADLPPGLEILSSNPPGQSGPGDGLRWPLERALPAGGSQAVEVTLRVPEDARPGDRHEIDFEVSSRERDSYAGDNRAVAAIEVVPGEPEDIELSISPGELQACSPSAVMVQATVRDGFGHPVADGTEVRWSVTAGKLGSERGVTASGLATVTLSAPQRAGLLTLRASAGDSDEEIDLSAVAGPPGALSVLAMPRIVHELETSTIHVSVLDACANAVEDGWTIDLQTQRGRWPNGLRALSAKTVDGEVKARLRVDDGIGPLRVSARFQGLLGEAQLSVTARPAIYLPLVVSDD